MSHKLPIFPNVQPLETFFKKADNFCLIFLKISLYFLFKKGMAALSHMMSCVHVVDKWSILLLALRI